VLVQHAQIGGSKGQPYFERSQRSGCGQKPRRFEPPARLRASHVWSPVFYWQAACRCASTARNTTVLPHPNNAAIWPIDFPSFRCDVCSVISQECLGLETHSSALRERMPELFQISIETWFRGISVEFARAPVIQFSRTCYPPPWGKSGGQPCGGKSPMKAASVPAQCINCGQRSGPHC
jgi:hypothetical protein